MKLKPELLKLSDLETCVCGGCVCRGWSDLIPCSEEVHVAQGLCTLAHVHNLRKEKSKSNLFSEGKGQKEYAKKAKLVLLRIWPPKKNIVYPSPKLVSFAVESFGHIDIILFVLFLLINYNITISVFSLPWCLQSYQHSAPPLALLSMIGQSDPLVDWILNTGYHCYCCCFC